MHQNVLTIQGAIVRQASRVLFNKLDFEVRRGEHWAVIGESGSGKTALLQLIAGRLPISGGTIHYSFLDNIIAKQKLNDQLSNPQKLIAFVGARHNFRNLSNTTDLYYQQRYNSTDSNDAPTVEAYLLAIERHPDVEIKWQLHQVTALLKLEHLLKTEIIKLSNGETKRLMIAAALLKNPQVLLLDNPMTGLDIQSRNGFNQILEQIAASKIAIIMATSPQEIPSVITNIATLKDCRIMSSGLKSELIHDLTAPSAIKLIDKQAIEELYPRRSQHGFTSIIQMDKVNVTYGDKQVLNCVSWQVKPGERWALLGPNGAGKSTLLSLVNGDNPQAYANHIILFDRKRGTGESIWDIKRNIGFISPELYQYFPADSSCLQTVLSGFFDTLGLFRQVTDNHNTVALQWMKALNIDQYARQLLKNVPLSIQRLCLLARALVKSPQLLILDEPCQGMDSEQQEAFKQVIDALCLHSNLTLIYVTHYQHELPNSINNLLRLDMGKVVA